MPNKYPGGYQIIDLGLNPTSRKYPGIYQKIQDSNKPTIITFSGLDPSFNPASTYALAHMTMCEYEVDDIIYYLAFVVTNWSDLSTVTITKGIFISEEDDVLFVDN